MALAIFDLDNTLLGGDSDFLWGVFLAEQQIVDAELYKRESVRFYQQYEAGTLDIDEFLAFSLTPLRNNSAKDLFAWREQFVREKIDPIILPKAIQLIEEHRAKGDHPVIITATNKFITAPIAERFGIPDLLATEPEYLDGQYTGRYVGTPTFKAGKIIALENWLSENQQTLGDSYFYSDSHNDIPLLEKVDYPVAVDPDPQLLQTAQTKAWPIISLR